MKTHLTKLMAVIVYFFTPEDSSAPTQINTISFNIERDAIGIGSAKALFWFMNAIIFVALISML